MAKQATPAPSVATRPVAAPAAAPAAGSRKTVCPVTKDEFHAAAQGLTVTLGNQQMVASPKEFSTGSLGWYANGKIVIDVGGKPCQVQVGLNLTIVGSKEL